jgi:hypothetical protein
MRQRRLGQKGRPRRNTIGGDHQRPLNRHDVRREGVDSIVTTGLGHNASTAAAMATASSSVGVGLISVVTTSSDQSGMLPCLRRGSSSRLLRNIRNPATTFWRVSAGSITSST